MVSLSELLGPPTPLGPPAELARSRSKAPVPAAALNTPDPAAFPDDTTALPLVAGPSVEATVTEADPAPARSLSADLRLEPKPNICNMMNNVH